MKRIKNINGFTPRFEENKTDLIFNKTGLNMVNRNPEAWTINETGTRLINKQDAKQQLVLASINPYRVGDEVKWSPACNVQVSGVRLIRLADIDNKLAARTGIEKQSAREWKHYSPEKFYPKKVLATQAPGFPKFNTASGSFYSLWCRQYDVLEIYANPWVWQFTCKKLQL